MKLSILAHTQSETLEGVVLGLGITKVLRNFSYTGAWAFQEQDTDLYISSVNMQVATATGVPPVLFNYERIFLDIGMSPTSLNIAIRVADEICKKKPETHLCFVQVQSLLLKSIDAYRELFSGKRYSFASMLGNGMSDIAHELEVLQAYPNAIPCVMFLKNKDKEHLGKILGSFWNVFPELVFWSEATLANVELETVARDIYQLRFMDGMRYIAMQATTIRESPSISARGLGRHTEVGKTYQMKEVISAGTYTFGRLDDDTYVVIDPPYFQKETN